ncbi:MAG: phosphoribosylglycinamide formyltransferase [Prevotella sp.]|jgi:phosphoribosylglycinamide formyltransferase-1|nr:phosphoribosylglycinamide formyltransferase [Prevotella sp.]MCH4181909.1 phosphoribosylglycinamide formyltransferase [Prevotella sp.]MCH4212211.1 phosphoribosylglycinamide formyltransferase [Prevotella sp.]MCH4241508.1 phosphoribosylglycinamide formyltransferase [Prevotella sp.]MCI1741623.1 phosphoribosylglycinamide formyltransferase [Prevotella sp.]
MTHIAIFVSGNGTNCENIIHYFARSSEVKISLVLSNKANAYALVRAEKAGIPTEVLPKAEFIQEDLLLNLMKKYHIDFIVLAGFLLLIPEFLIKAYPQKIINIHPALLPKFGGKGMWGYHVHEAVKAAGEKETGMTVHWVNGQYDKGQVIAQYKTSLSPQDTPNDIAAKEHILEIKYFPKVIEKIIKAEKH